MSRLDRPCGNQGIIIITPVSRGLLNNACRQNDSCGREVSPADSTSNNTTSSPRAKPNNAPSSLSAEPNPTVLINADASIVTILITINTARKIAAKDITIRKDSSLILSGSTLTKSFANIFAAIYATTQPASDKDSRTMPRTILNNTDTTIMIKTTESKIVIYLMLAIILLRNKNKLYVVINSDALLLLIPDSFIYLLQLR